jgi:hypothetical protein
LRGCAGFLPTDRSIGQPIQTIGTRKFFGIVAAACGLFLSAGAASKQPATPARQEAASTHPPEASNAVKTQLHNVNYYFSDFVFVHVEDLNGQLEPIAPATYPVFDDKDSFALRVDSAEMSITAENLANVLNSYVFARGGSPVSGLSIIVQNGELKIKGRLHQAGALPFETDGAISATADGKLQLHAAKVKALHIPVKGLMSAFGVDLADLIKNGEIPGVETTGDDLILDPALVFPPPHLRGKVTAARLEGNSILLTFGAPQRGLKPLASG